MTRPFHFAPSLASLSLVVALAGGCDVGLNNGLTGNGGDGGTANDLAGGGGGGGDGLPCDVYKVLQTHCLSCHGSTPTPGTPVSLTTYAQLTAPSAADPKMTYAQRSLARMLNAASPMPPKPASLVTGADLTTFQNWVNAGAPKGNCGGGTDGGSTPDPLNADPTCTSKGTWNPGRENGNMEPGNACIACHQVEGGPFMNIGGTLYATGHEPARCNGTSANGSNAAAMVGDANVVITEMNGTVHTLNVNVPSGNFYYASRTFTKPYTAKVTLTVNGQTYERVMVTPQTDGDCNKCHTDMGAMMAPGRVTLPLVP